MKSFRGLFAFSLALIALVGVPMQAHAAATITVVLFPEIVLVGGGLTAVSMAATAKDKTEPAPGGERKGGRQPSGGGGFQEPRGNGNLAPHLDESGRGRGEDTDRDGVSEGAGPLGLFKTSSRTTKLAVAGLVLAVNPEVNGPISVAESLQTLVILGVFTKTQSETVAAELSARVTNSADARLRLNTDGIEGVVITAENQDLVAQALARDNGISVETATYFLFLAGQLN